MHTTILPTNHDFIGQFLHADGSISTRQEKEKTPVGMIFQYNRVKKEMWIVALTDSDCHNVHCPAEIPPTDPMLSNTDGKTIEWMAPEQWHWEKLLVDVCHCALTEKPGIGDRREGYTFDAGKANESLTGIGMNMAEYLYWTATEQSNGNAVIVGWGEINEEEPMPYSDDEIADVEVDMRLRMVGKCRL